MSEWKLTHGKDDDPNGPPTYFSVAAGVELDPPIKQGELHAFLAEMNSAAEVFVDEMAAANEKMQQVLSSSKAGTTLGEKILSDRLKVFHEEAGMTVVVMRTKSAKKSKKTKTTKEPKKPKASTKKASEKATDVPVENKPKLLTHKQLAEKYDAYTGALSEGDINRAELVKHCEDFLMMRAAMVRRRGDLRVTPAQLMTYVSEKMPSFEMAFGLEVLIPTLVSDGWLIFQVKEGGSAYIVPYGGGLPGHMPGVPNHPVWDKS